MSNRDDFSEKTKRAVAARASWHCSFFGCQKSTVGPSEESSHAVTTIGVASHICAAAPGGRRYVAPMSPEERADIGNAIWLCADHATLIDRDEVAYTIEKLHEMKQTHEQICAQAVQAGSTIGFDFDLLAIGPEIVCTGNVTQIATTSWTLRLKHFVIGNTHKIISFIDGFSTSLPEDRYILSNEYGDGRLLSEAPKLIKEADGYSLTCPVALNFPRVDVQKLGSDLARHPETGDLYLDKNNSSACVCGLDYLPQKIHSCLSIQRGDNVFHPSYGMRFAEYFEAFRGSPWLELLLKLDVVRQASIPFRDAVTNKQYTPLGCVTRVHSVNLLSEARQDHKLSIRVNLDVQGIGQWQNDLSIYLPTMEELARRAERIANLGSVAFS